MKMYLMMGAAALTMGFAFVSCSSDDEIYNPNADALIDNYQSSFEKNVGKPAAGHTWGFNQTRATRATDMNGNMWETCPSLGENEAKDVFDYVNMTRYAMKNADPEHKFTEKFPVNIENYFVTHVYTGTDTYTNADGGDNILGSSKMNHLQIKEKAEGSLNKETGEISSTGWYHVNDFNAGMSVDYNGNTKVVNSGTLDFAYHSTEDSKYHNKWIAVKGEDIDKKYKGYYYICFDFEAYKTVYSEAKTEFRLNFQYKRNENQTDNVSVGPISLTGFYKTAEAILGSGYTTYTYEGTTINLTPEMFSDIRVINGNQYIAPNDVYTDWIIRLVPATPDDNGGGEETDTQVLRESGRIFCEDLGTIGDFDFNDVVFDAEVYYWEKAGTPSRTDITLLAAGGTMNIKVAGVDVHKAFNQPDSKMINTGDDSKCVKGLNAVPFTAETAYAHLIDIPIAVQHGNAIRVLEAEPGKAPQKFCAPIGTEWADEYVNISRVYTDFKKWVTTLNTPAWTPTAVLVDRVLSNNAEAE